MPCPRPRSLVAGARCRAKGRAAACGAGIQPRPDAAHARSAQAPFSAKDRGAAARRDAGRGGPARDHPRARQPLLRTLSAAIPLSLCAALCKGDISIADTRLSWLARRSCVVNTLFSSPLSSLAPAAAPDLHRGRVQKPPLGGHDPLKGRTSVAGRRTGGRRVRGPGGGVRRGRGHRRGPLGGCRHWQHPAGASPAARGVSGTPRAGQHTPHVPSGRSMLVLLFFAMTLVRG